MFLGWSWDELGFGYRRRTDTLDFGFDLGFGFRCRRGCGGLLNNYGYLNNLNWNRSRSRGRGRGNRHRRERRNGSLLNLFSKCEQVGHLY